MKFNEIYLETFELMNKILDENKIGNLNSDSELINKLEKNFKLFEDPNGELYIRNIRSQCKYPYNDFLITVRETTAMPFKNYIQSNLNHRNQINNIFTTIDDDDLFELKKSMGLL